MTEAHGAMLQCRRLYRMMFCCVFLLFSSSWVYCLIIKTTKV
jgi:hypothetical protein